MPDQEKGPEAKDGSSDALPWFLLGLGVGAGLALWFAPESGEATRAGVRKRVRALRDVVEEQFEGAREKVVDRLDRAAEAVSATDDDDEERASVSASRETVQRRLRAARARRRPASTGDGAEGEGSPS